MFRYQQESVMRNSFPGNIISRSRTYEQCLDISKNILWATPSLAGSHICNTNLNPWAEKLRFFVHPPHVI